MALVHIIEGVAINTDDIRSIRLVVANSVYLPEDYVYASSPFDSFYSEMASKTSVVNITYMDGGKEALKFYPHTEGLERAKAAMKRIMDASETRPLVTPVKDDH